MRDRLVPFSLVLKIILCTWFIGLIIESICNDIPSLTLIAGTICASFPIAIVFAWYEGAYVFQAVLIFITFTTLVITLHIVELMLR